LFVTANGQALITVRDTGISIEPGAAARIFEPFVRLDAARGRDTGGTGLGLALVRAIVTAHGGTVEVESAPGAGSRFTIRLPLASSKEARGAGASSGMRGTLSSSWPRAT
jgi:two-component system, OmpR family, sensor kinase